MITVTVGEDTLLEMLLDRVEYWTSDEDVIDLYRDYYKKLIDCGCFEGCKLNVATIVDSDYCNNLTVINKEDFEDYGVEGFEDDKIEAFNEEQNLYLISNY